MLIKTTLLFKDGHTEEHEYHPEVLAICEGVTLRREGEDIIFRRFWTRSAKGRVCLFVQDGTPKNTLATRTKELFG